MKRVAKWTLWLASYIVVAAVSGFGVWLYDRIPPKSGSCFTHALVIATNSNGDAVERQDDICEGIAYSDIVTLGLVLKDSPQRDAFFVYVPDYAFATASWAGNNVVIVYVEQMDRVFTQLHRLGDVEIRYQTQKP